MRTTLLAALLAVATAAPALADGGCNWSKTMASTAAQAEAVQTAQASTTTQTR